MAPCPAHLADPPGTWTLPIAGPHTDHHRRALCRGRLPTLPSDLRHTSLRPSYKADGARGQGSLPVTPQGGQRQQKGERRGEPSSTGAQ